MKASRLADGSGLLTFLPASVLCSVRSCHVSKSSVALQCVEPLKKSRRQGSLAVQSTSPVRRQPVGGHRLAAALAALEAAQASTETTANGLIGWSVSTLLLVAGQKEVWAASVSTYFALTTTTSQTGLVHGHGRNGTLDEKKDKSARCIHIDICGHCPALHPPGWNE